MPTECWVGVRVDVFVAVRVHVNALILLHRFDLLIYYDLQSVMDENVLFLQQKWLYTDEITEIKTIKGEGVKKEDERKATEEKKEK